MIGRLTYWNGLKGYGFITVTDGSGTQYFFHRSNFIGPGDPVLSGLVVFNLGEPLSIGKKVQAVGVRYATSADIEQEYNHCKLDAGVSALAGAGGAA
jgi:cold shock CspA family protein